MPIRKSKDLPATYGALDGVRKELKSDIASVNLRVTSLEKTMKSEFQRVDARFDQMDARFDEMNRKTDARFDEMNRKTDAKFDEMAKQTDAKFEEMILKMDARFETLIAGNHHMRVLMEEQNSRNRASYEGAEAVREQHEDLTRRVEALEEFQHDITKRLK